MSAPETDTLVARTLAGDVTLAAGPAKLERPAGMPTAIGRFTVIRELGAGGMGVVYAAHDEQLDRKVAIKLLHNLPGPDTTEGHARLLREAQALARLSHPNVVAIYEVGSFFGHVFLAMEHVQGQTVRAWLEAEPRPWREVVRVFREAGAGLAAAHAAGLVHRDFKPDNAVVGDDGRVRVLDFGLARAPEPAEAAVTGELQSAPPLGSQLTVAGAVVGTPAYIAPELYLRRPADHRSDQFAFCLSMWEGLYGERPFRADTMQALALAICDGKLSPPPANRRVPAWLHAILVRGLNVDPARRFASMDALLARLAHDPERARVRLLGALVLACVAALIGLGLHNLGSRREGLCTGAGPAIASVWGPVQKDSIKRAFVGSGLAFARDTEARVQAGLDAYAAGWAAAHHDACADTAVRREQSQELQDLRMACLERRRGGLAQTIALLQEADPATLERAVQAVDALPAIDPCANSSYVRAEHPLPASPAEAIAEAELRTRFARIEALLAAGRLHEAEALLASTATATVPEHLTPELTLLRGRVDIALSRYPAARAALEQAYLTARRVGDDPVALTAASRMLGAIDDDHRDRELWQLWARLAEVEVDRSGSVSERLAVRLHRAAHLRRISDFAGARDALAGAIEQCDADRECQAGPLSMGLAAGLGLAHAALGDGEQALGLHRAAHAGRVERYGPRHPLVAASLDSISGALQLLGRFDEARRAGEQALALRLAAYGREHAVVAESYNNLAGVLLDLGEVSRAAEYFRETAEIEAKIFGPDSPQIAITLANLASALHSLQQHEAALEALERAHQIQQTALAPYHMETLFTLALLAGVEHSLGRLPASEQHYRAALKVTELQLDPGHQHAAMVRQNFAVLLHRLGRDEEALELLLPTRARLAERLGEDHVYLADFDTTLGLVEAGAGRTASAERRLRGALERYARLSGPESTRSLAAIVGLAKLVVADRPAEALTLAEQAASRAAGERSLELLTDLHEALALALVGAGSDRTRARASACFVDRALDSGEAAASRRKRLRALGLLTPGCP